MAHMAPDQRQERPGRQSWAGVGCKSDNDGFLTLWDCYQGLQAQGEKDSVLEKQIAFFPLGACVNNSWSSVSRLYFVFVCTVYTYIELELIIL